MRVTTYSASRILAEWKLRQGLVTSRTDSTVTRADGLDIDTLMMAQIDAWYMGCLLSMPPESLPLTDISASLTMTRAPDGAGLVTLPAECLRVVSMTMTGWQRPALITTPLTSEAAEQLSPFTRGKTARPVAIISGSSMRLYTPPADATSRLLSVMAVTLPREGEYLMTEQLIAAMPMAINPIS